MLILANPTPLKEAFIVKWQELTPEQKQTELQRHRDIILATLDYLLSTHRGMIVFDDEDFIADHYEKQKMLSSLNMLNSDDKLKSLCY